MNESLSLLIGSLILLLLLAVYFLPSLLAVGKRNGRPIFFLNLITGWTLVGWIACFIWACVSPKQTLEEIA